jgi:hypothetical protein
VATSLVLLFTWSVAVFRDLLPSTVGERAVATGHPGVALHPGTVGERAVATGVALLPGTVGERAVATGVALLPGTVGERAVATGQPGVAFLLHGVLCAAAVAVLHVARSAAFMLFLCGTVMWLHCSPATIVSGD